MYIYYTMASTQQWYPNIVPCNTQSKEETEKRERPRTRCQRFAWWQNIYDDIYQSIGPSVAACGHSSQQQGSVKLDCVGASASIKLPQMGTSHRRIGQNRNWKCRPVLQKDNHSCPLSGDPVRFLPYQPRWPSPGIWERPEAVRG